MKKDVGGPSPALMESVERRLLLGGDPFPSLSLLEHPDNPVLRMATERGNIYIELLANEAPETVDGFIRSLNLQRSLNETFFHRLEPGVSLDAASWFFMPDVDADGYGVNELGARPNAMSFHAAEGALANTERTIAATLREITAPRGGVTVSDMVFNLADNSGVYAPDEFVVFARVIDDASWAVVQGIASLPRASFQNAGNANAFVQDVLHDVPVDEAYVAGDDISPEIVVRSTDMMVIRAAGAPDYYRHTVYSPEGFTGSTISEFLPMVNPNDETVYYEVRARYERGLFGDDVWVRDAMISRGMIAGNTRGGITISSQPNWAGGPVIAGRPYSIEVWSTLPISASLSHYDFGSAAGSTLTDEASTTWYLPDTRTGRSQTSHDFLVFTNLSATTAIVEITVFSTTGQQETSIGVHVEALRRGGFDMSFLAIGEGSHLVRMTSDVPIIAARTHYGVNSNQPIPVEGYSVPGLAGAASSIGVAPIAYTSTQMASSLSMAFYNPGAESVTISLDFLPPGSANAVHSMTDALTVAPGAMGVLELPGNFAGTDAAMLSMVYRATGAVYAQVSFRQLEDGYSAGAAIAASTRWQFAEGFTDPVRTSSNILEEKLAIFNPSGARFGQSELEASVTIRFRYSDGFVMDLERTIAAGALLDLGVSRLDEVVEQAQNGRFYYSMEVVSDVPVIAQLLHTDALLTNMSTGGFSLFGRAFGELVRLEGIDA